MAAVREALAANLSAIPDVQVSAYALSQPTPPGIQVLPGEVSYDLAMARGLDRWNFVVQAFVSFGADVGSQVLLDRMLAPTGPGSVKTVLEAEPTLSGAADDLRVTGASGYRLLDNPAGGQMVLVEFQVEVYVSN